MISRSRRQMSFPDEGPTASRTRTTFKCRVQLSMSLGGERSCGVIADGGPLLNLGTCTAMPPWRRPREVGTHKRRMWWLFMQHSRSCGGDQLSLSSSEDVPRSAMATPYLFAPLHHQRAAFSCSATCFGNAYSNTSAVTRQPLVLASSLPFCCAFVRVDIHFSAWGCGLAQYPFLLFSVLMMRPPTASALQTFELGVALGFLATVTVVARFAARRKTKTKYLADDYVTLLTWLFLMGLIINGGLRSSMNPPYQTDLQSDLYTVAFNAGLGHHELFLSEAEDDLFGKVHKRNPPQL